MMWRTLGRNKKSITIDIRTAEGQDLVRRLAAQVDVVIENYRPGKLEEWHLSPEELRRHNEAHHPGQTASSRSSNAEPIGNERSRSTDAEDRQSRR
jgi:hypothetical protein